MCGQSGWHCLPQTTTGDPYCLNISGCAKGILSAHNAERGAHSSPLHAPKPDGILRQQNAGSLPRPGKLTHGAHGFHFAPCCRLCTCCGPGQVITHCGPDPPLPRGLQQPNACTLPLAQVASDFFASSSAGQSSEQVSWALSSSRPSDVSGSRQAYALCPCHGCGLLCSMCPAAAARMLFNTVSPTLSKMTPHCTGPAQEEEC